MLWIDKYRPDSLQSLTYNEDLTAILTRLAQNKRNLPHLLFYGPSGAGKKTRIMSLLKEIYGTPATKVKPDTKTIKGKEGTKAVEITVMTSKFHTELTPSMLGTSDKLVVQEVIKEIAGTRSIDCGTDFKVIVLHEADELSRQAQNALRRTMEKYTEYCRLILCATSVCSVIPAVRSRCFHIRVALPDPPHLSAVLKHISTQENFTLPDPLVDKIIRASEQNTRKAILMLETTKLRQYPFTPDQVPEMTDWELYISQIVIDILGDLTPRSLLLARQRLYELLTHCIPANLILEKMVFEILGKIDGALHAEVIKWAAHYDHQMRNGSKPIYHLEAFVAKSMALYKKYSIGNF
ncbi:Replication factor C subunit RFC3 [Pelomyxa schiedti]|nr:Replication factor C subunit RFC3 [Pelomyxa schiedti]